MVRFYCSKYKNANRQNDYMFFTQFESCDACYTFPCFNEFNLKVTFDFTITIPADMIALSNMPVISSKPPSDGKKKAAAGSEEGEDLKVVKFATTPNMSTYVCASKSDF